MKKIVFISGASSGMGRETALFLALHMVYLTKKSVIIVTESL